MTKEQIIEKWVALLVPSKDITLINAYKKYLTEDLNSLSLPPAEGAVRHLTDDEIEKHGMEGGLRDGELQMYWEGATWYRSYAQKIADKMVEERLRGYHLNEGYDVVIVGNPDKEIDGDIFEDIKVAALELGELRGLKVMITGFYTNYFKSRDSHE